MNSGRSVGFRPPVRNCPFVFWSLVASVMLSDRSCILCFGWSEAPLWLPQEFFSSTDASGTTLRCHRSNSFLKDRRIRYDNLLVVEGAICVSFSFSFYKNPLYKPLRRPENEELSLLGIDFWCCSLQQQRLSRCRLSAAALGHVIVLRR